MNSIKNIKQISNHDKAIARIIIAKDLIHSGNLPEALKAIDYAIHNIEKIDSRLVDDEILLLLSGVKD